MWDKRFTAAKPEAEGEMKTPINGLLWGELSEDPYDVNSLSPSLALLPLFKAA